jgi:hypothetical protein
MWDVEMVLILRHMIDDLDQPPKYTDEKLQQLVLVAAQFVQTENIFETYYTINIENFSLKPDPTKVDTRDNAFINLTLLKSACLLSSAPLIKSSGKFLRVKEGQHEFDSRGNFEGDKFASQTFCQSYKDAKWDYSTSGNGSLGDIIIGPYRSLIEQYRPWR